jgi:hypothetical protein
MTFLPCFLASLLSSYYHDEDDSATQGVALLILINLLTPTYANEIKKSAQDPLCLSAVAGKQARSF